VRRSRSSGIQDQSTTQSPTIQRSTSSGNNNVQPNVTSQQIPDNTIQSQPSQPTNSNPPSGGNSGSSGNNGNNHRNPRSW
jgi:hypothetical protein